VLGKFCFVLTACLVINVLLTNASSVAASSAPERIQFCSIQMWTKCLITKAVCCSLGKEQPSFGGASVVYELDHLATFNVSPKQGLVRPTDGVKRLRDMEASSGIWAMRVQLIIDRREIVVLEKATQKVGASLYCKYLLLRLTEISRTSTSRRAFLKKCT
jgi:Phosphotyrosine-binding domain